MPSDARRRHTGIAVVGRPAHHRGAHPFRRGPARADRYWIHVDVDVLDPAVFAAVDSPDPGGVEVTALTSLLSELWSAAAGMTLCIYDPDLDPDRSGARLLTRLVVTALG